MPKEKENKKMVDKKNSPESLAEKPSEEVQKTDKGVGEKLKKTEDKKESVAGIAYVFGSFNNTIVHITDLAGNTISRVSGGMVTKHSRLKANPTTAMFVAKRAAERARDIGINALYIRTKGKTGAPGLGPGAHAAVKTLGKEGFRIAGIMDVTKTPRGGPKKKGGKRGRRV